MCFTSSHLCSRVGEHISLGISLLYHSDMCSPILSEMCFPYKKRSDMCSPTWEARIMFPGKGTHSTKDMCFPSRGTLITSGLASPSQETNIPSDMCSPTWETHRFNSSDRGTHFTSDMCFPGRDRFTLSQSSTYSRTYFRIYSCL